MSIKSSSCFHLPYQRHENQSSRWNEHVQDEVRRPPAEQDLGPTDGVVHSLIELHLQLFDLFVPHDILRYTLHPCVNK